MQNVKMRVGRFLDRVDVLCGQYGRDPREISVLAATKYADVVAMQAAIDAGITLLGENRVQDAQKRFPFLRGNFRKYFIGHLQTNKIREVVRIFDCIESVDSLRLAKVVNDESRKRSKKMDVLIQVKVSGEDSQYGIDIGEVRYLIRNILELDSLRVTGLMTILPQERSAAEKAAADMFLLFSSLKGEFANLHVLSMGMSHDYDIALKHGSNELRIGSLFFGE